MAQAIDSFSFFKSYKDSIEILSNDESKKALLYAIYRYAWFDEEPNFELYDLFDPNEIKLMQMAWVSIQPIIKKSKNKSRKKSQ